MQEFALIKSKAQGEHILICDDVNAIWLAESGLSLGRSLKDVLDVSGERLATS